MVDQRYRKHQGAVFSLKYHLVWCPKYRLPVLEGVVAERLLVLLREKAAEMNATIQALEVLPDHVHLFIETDPTLAPAHIANQFKGFTSRTCAANSGTFAAACRRFGAVPTTSAASGTFRTPL